MNQEPAKSNDSASIIQDAIALRESGNHNKSRLMLAELLPDPEFGARAHLHTAWSYDNEGKESQAVSHYESALVGPLSGTDRFDALFGLSSTLRSLGRYENAVHYFEQTLREYPKATFPQVKAIQPFYAMCLYNLGRNKEAVSLLLELLVDNTNNDEIKQYERAIRLYAEDLDRTW